MTKIREEKYQIVNKDTLEMERKAEKECRKYQLNQTKQIHMQSGNYNMVNKIIFNVSTKNNRTNKVDMLQQYKNSIKRRIRILERLEDQ